MQKINFEDATLVTQAKVTIGGTDYEVTPATYSGGTDLDADTLNDLQDNFENALVDAYSTSEVKTNKVWVDGKPIYRKTVYLEATTSTQNIPVSNVANNIYQLWIDTTHSFYGSGGIISDWETSGRYRITIDSGAIYYVCSSLSYKDGFITFEYTKTTD